MGGIACKLPSADVCTVTIPLNGPVPTLVTAETMHS